MKRIEHITDIKRGNLVKVKVDGKPVWLGVNQVDLTGDFAKLFLDNGETYTANFGMLLECILE